MFCFVPRPPLKTSIIYTNKGTNTTTKVLYTRSGLSSLKYVIYTRQKLYI